MLAASIIRARLLIVLMMEASNTSRMPLNYQTTQHNNPEDIHLHTRSHKNLKCHMCIRICMCLYPDSKHKIPAGFEVLIAVSTMIPVFCFVAPCSLVEVYQRFRSPCCFHHQGVNHRPDDGGSKDLWNIGKLLPNYTALQPRRQPSTKYPFIKYGPARSLSTLKRLSDVRSRCQVVPRPTKYQDRHREVHVESRSDALYRHPRRIQSKALNNKGQSVASGF
jgi:hypothetical protein